MKNQTQEIAMYMALGAAVTMLVLYFSGQLKFVNTLKVKVKVKKKERKVSRDTRVRRVRMVSRLMSPTPTLTHLMTRNKHTRSC